METVGVVIAKNAIATHKGGNMMTIKIVKNYLTYIIM